MAMSKQDKNNALLMALNHPLRRKILEQIENSTNGGMSPSMLADALKEPLGNVSYHVRMLHERAGVLKLAKTKPRRGAIEHFYVRAGNAVDKKVTETLELIGKD